jgi:hypothetical protein
VGCLFPVEANTHAGASKPAFFAQITQFSLAKELHNGFRCGFTEMETEEIFYTDGQDIVVTLSTLQVRDRFYSLKNIKKHSLAILQPARLPGVVLFIIGLAMALCGMMDAFSPNSLQQAGLVSVADTNHAAQWTGTALTIGGLLLTVLLREKYAVRIATEDGEQDAVVSTRREYIREIIDALNRASMMIDVRNAVRLRRT